MKIRPLQDRILVQPIKDKEVRKGGIIIPDSAKEKPIEGRVKAVGAGKVGEDGKRVKLDVESRRQGAVQQIRRHRDQNRRDDFLLMREDDILGIVE